MVVVPPGQFTMGSPDDDPNRSREEGPRVAITIGTPLAVGKFEVTFAEWDACVADGGCAHRPDDKGWGRDKRPVINVSWSHITQQYLPWLSRKTQQSYRLLSEAEWEYAARAGRQTAYQWGDGPSGAKANCKGCDNRWVDRTAPVGSYEPNAFGLHDMHGNVFELTGDCWNPSLRGVPTDGKTRTDGTCSSRVIRGGSWFTAASWLRASARMADPVGYSNANVGFRVARQMTSAAPIAVAAQAVPAKAAEPTQTNDATFWMHNDSRMRMTHAPNGEITVVYERVKDKIAATIRNGDRLLSLMEHRGALHGSAWRFKRGCPAAAYAVSGAYTDAARTTFVLEGAFPEWNGCEVKGYSRNGPLARLEFTRDGRAEGGVAEAVRMISGGSSDQTSVVKAAGGSLNVQLAFAEISDRSSCGQQLRFVQNAIRNLQVRIVSDSKLTMGDQIQIEVSGFPDNLSSTPFTPNAPLLSRSYISPYLYIGLPDSFEATQDVFRGRDDSAGSGWPASVTGQGVMLPLYERTASETQTVRLRPHKVGRFDLTMHIVSTISTPCKPALLSRPIMFQVEVVPKPEGVRLSTPAACHLSEGKRNDFLGGAKVTAISSEGMTLTPGRPVEIRWELERQLDKKCNTPLFLVVSTPNRVRFEGNGFLAIPPGALGPFGVAHNKAATRVFVPLHLVQERRGSFKLKSYDTGPISATWALVEAPAAFLDPKRKHDFDSSAALIASGPEITGLPLVAPGVSKLLVRDAFTLDKPKRTILSNSGHYRLEVFDRRYKVFSVASNELLLDRAGVDPNFSPSGRFVGSHVVAGSSFELHDLVAGVDVRKADAELVAWGHNDAILAIAVRTAIYSQQIEVQQALVDDPPIVYPGETHKVAPTDFVVGIDIEAALLSGFRLSYADSREWVDLLRPLNNSKSLQEKTSSRRSDCAAAKQTLQSGPAHRSCGTAIQQQNLAVLSQRARDGFAEVESLLQLRTMLPIDWLGHRRKKAGMTPAPILAWRVNEEQMRLSHHCSSTMSAYQDCSDTYHQSLKALRIDHAISEATTIVAAPRMPAANRTFTADDQAGAHLPARLVDELQTLGVSLAKLTSFGTLNRLDKSKVDWGSGTGREIWLDELRRRLVNTIPTAASHLPSVDASIKAWHGGVDICDPYSTHPIRKTVPFPTIGITHVGHFQTLRKHLWIFLSECSNGAGGSNVLAMITGSSTEPARTLSLSKAIGKVDGKRFTEFSWPESVDAVRIFDERLMLLTGKWSGGRWVMLYDLAADMLVQFWKRIDEADALSTLHVSSDEGHLIQLNAGGRIIIYSLRNGQRVLTGMFTDDELIMHRADGYYFATAEGAQFVRHRFEGVAGTHSFHQFASTLNRPDLVKAALAGEKIGAAPKLTAPPTLKIDVAARVGSGERHAEISYEAASVTGLKSLSLFVDGRPLRELPLDGRSKKDKIPVKLPKSAKWLAAVAVDVKGFESVPQQAKLDPPSSKSDSTLHVIAFGNDTYRDRAYERLSGAGPDADRLWEALKQTAAQAYKSVQGEVWGAKKAAEHAKANAVPPDLREEIPAKIREVVARAREGDTIVLFAAGHGDVGPDGKFYLITPTTRKSNLPDTALAWDDIAKAFDGVKARVVVLLDACRSGSAGAATNDQAALSLTSRGTPIAVIAAAKGRQESKELPANGGGYFTNAIIDALLRNRTKTDTNGDGVIELSELYGAIKGVIVEQSEGKQTPWISRNRMVGSVPLF